jgi:hypothetical protein
VDSHPIEPQIPAQPESRCLTSGGDREFPPDLKAAFADTEMPFKIGTQSEWPATYKSSFAVFGAAKFG